MICILILGAGFHAGLVIGFVETAVSVAEGAGNAVLMVRANHDIDVEVTVRLTTADQSAIGERVRLFCIT